ncbi:MAG: hypothetical protein R2697_11000 [Ilumatobacteraceae bacterium]
MPQSTPHSTGPRASSPSTIGDALLVRTADHGDLLGSHGGLHQKWFQLYDESSRASRARSSGSAPVHSPAAGSTN